MSAISVTKARDNIYQLISDVNANCQPITFDGVEYQGTVKIIRMWTHYDGLR